MCFVFLCMLSVCLCLFASKTNSCAFMLHGALSDFGSDYKRDNSLIFFFSTHCCRVQVSRSATTDALRQSQPPRKKKEKKKRGSLGFYLFPSLLISTLCDSLGFPSILGDTQLRRRPPIKRGGRNAEWHRGRWWEIKRAGERNARLVKEENRLDLHVLGFFSNPTLVCGLAFVNRVRPVTLAAGMLYVLVPIQLFVSVTQEARKEALT